MVRLEPISIEEEVTVDVEVARIVSIDLGTEGISHALLVEVIANPAYTFVAQVARVLTLAANIVDILASTLVGADLGIVTIDGGGNADPGTLAVVAGLDHAFAARQGVVHGLAGPLVKNSGVTTFTTSHGTVVLILGESIGKTITDQNGFEVDVAFLVGEDLRGHDRDIVASIRLAGNVEVLRSVFRELLKEQREESVNVLAGSNGVTDGGATVRVADVDGLVKEDDRGIVVPGEVIVDGLDVLADRTRAKLQKQPSKRRAAGATVQPQDDGVILGVIARLKEPFLQY